MITRWQKQNRRKIGLTGLLFAGLLVLLSACAQNESGEETPASENRLVVYTAHKEAIYKPIIREFEERSGIWVDVVAGGTNEMLQQIASENGQSGADIMFGGGVDSLQAYEAYFEPYVTAQDEKLDPAYASPDHAYTVFSKLPTVFVYNTKLVLPSGAPRTWQQLLEYQWEGNIAFADPEKSGSAYTALSILVQRLNREKTTEEAVAAFTKNLAGDLSDGSNTIVEDVASGKKMIGITLEETALKKKAAGADIEMVYPRQATCAVPDGGAIIKGAAHRENAEKFMEFIVSDDVQHLLEDQLYRRSVRTDFSSSEIADEMRYDIAYSNTHREEILQAWDSYMGQTKRKDE